MAVKTWLVGVRASAALTAYSTALDWLQRYPAAEVEHRLNEKIAEKQQLVDEAAGRRPMGREG